MKGIIYLHSNKINGKVYVGQTINSLRARSSGHRSQARKGINRPFYNAIRKYGWGSFDHQAISAAADQESLDNLEKVFIILFKSSDMAFGYNLSSGGEGGGKRSDAVKEAISRRMIGNKRGLGSTHTLEERVRISLRARGRQPIKPGTKLPPEWREAIGRGHRGKTLSPEANRNTHAWQISGNPKFEAVKEKLRSQAKIAALKRWHPEVAYAIS